MFRGNEGRTRPCLVSPLKACRGLVHLRGGFGMAEMRSLEQDWLDCVQVFTGVAATSSETGLCAVHTRGTAA